MRSVFQNLPYDTKYYVYLFHGDESQKIINVNYIGHMDGDQGFWIPILNCSSSCLSTKGHDHEI